MNVLKISRSRWEKGENRKEYAPTCLIAASLSLVLFFNPASALDNDYAARMRALLQSQLLGALQTDLVIQAIRAQNLANQAISPQQIQTLDQTWRREIESRQQPWINRTLTTPLSRYLRQLCDGSHGLYTEIFVTDAHGLNVGQSNPTSDYWQGDEAKWQQTFLLGQSAVHIGEVDQDESTQVFQAQLSFTLTDPDTQAPIGAATVGVNLDLLME